MSTSISIAKNQAKLLRARLSDLGVIINHSQSLEGVAAVHQAKDWNTYLSTLDSQNKEPITTATKSSLIAGGGFVDLPISLYEKDCKFTHLTLAMGFGKSKIIKDLCDNAINNNNHVMVISFLPFGTNFLEIADNENDPNYHLTKIDISHINDKASIGLSLPKKNQKAKVHFYQVVCKELLNKKSDFNKAEDLNKVIDIIYQNNTTESLNSLSYILVDGIDTFKINTRFEIEKAILPLVRGNAKVVISSQVNKKDHLFDANYQHTNSLITNSATARYNKHGEGFRYIVDDKTSSVMAIDMLFETHTAKDIASYLKMKMHQNGLMEDRPQLIIDYTSATLDIIIDYLVNNRDVKGFKFGILEIKNCLSIDMLKVILDDDLVNEQSRMNLIDILKQFPHIDTNQLKSAKFLPKAEKLYEYAVAPIHYLLSEYKNKSHRFFDGKFCMIAKSVIKVTDQINDHIKKSK